MSSLIDSVAEREVMGRAVGRVQQVSAVVINYQGEAYLEACLRSIEALEPPVDEIVVVENGSTDGSLNILNTHFRGVELVRLHQNVGASTGRNVGLRAAKHRHVLLVDNDVVLAPDTLAKLRAALEARPDLALVQPRAVYKSDPTRVHYDGGSMHYAGLLALRNSGVPLAEAAGHGVVDVPAVISLALLVDKIPVVEVGGFDEEMFILFEDLDLSYRLRAAGHGLAVVEDAVVLHDSGTAGISFRAGAYPPQRVFLHSRNRWFFLAKNLRLWTLFLAAPGILVYEAAWLAFTLRHGTLRDWLRGKRAFFGHSRRLWQKRRKVQRQRRVGDRRLLVGGPLTLSPALEGRSGLGARVLDGALRGWWGIVRWLVV